MTDNVWLYVFGFATYILLLKLQKLIGKTDIYNVLPPVFICLIISELENK